MAAPPAGERRVRGGVRPFMLAAGLALIWFVEFQAGDVAAAEAPEWGVGLLVAVRLFVDFVGASLVVSLVRLLLALGRYGMAYWRARVAARAG